jgi:hypothetical protein
MVCFWEFTWFVKYVQFVLSGLHHKLLAFYLPNRMRHWWLLQDPEAARASRVREKSWLLCTQPGCLLQLCLSHCQALPLACPQIQALHLAQKATEQLLEDQPRGWLARQYRRNSTTTTWDSWLMTWIWCQEMTTARSWPMTCQMLVLEIARFLGTSGQELAAVMRQRHVKHCLYANVV